MIDTRFLRGSDGTGNAVAARVNTQRLVASTVLKVDSVNKWPTGAFLATVGTIDVNGYLTSNVTEFRGHITAGDIIIDTYEAGYADVGNTVNQYVILKQTTGWSNLVQDSIAELQTEDITRASRTVSDFVVSGGILTLLSGLNASFTALVAYQAGLTITVALLATRAYTASKDTYVDVLRGGTNLAPTGTLVYTEVANGAAAPALAANSIRVGKVITSGVAITSIIQYGKDSLAANANTIYPSNLPIQKLWINNRDLGGTNGSGVFNMASSPYGILDPSDYYVPGKTTYMRLVVTLNKTASDGVAAVVSHVATAAPLFGVGSNNSQVGTNGLVAGQEITNNGTNSSVSIRSVEMLFPATTTPIYLRMWNFSSATNAIAVPVAYLEIYWR